MALIKCPECKKKISDQCESCPNCGYPIKANNEAAANPTDREEKAPSEGKKPIFKQVWFWIAIVVVIAAAVTTIILLLNRDVKPKVDENGQPIFLELTDEVYTNADKYLGYYVNIKGKVFQNLGDNGEIKGVQVWIDPDNCEQNLMIHYTTEGSFKDGDYVICTGYIKEIHTYTNTYGTELSVPLIYSTDLRSASYIEVMAPTVSTIIPENLTYEQYGYTLTIDKVEFAENETRLYLTATNNGKATWYVDVDASAIIQNGKQFNSEKNYDANYEEVPYNLSQGISASGIVTFPAIGDGDFEYVLEMHSDDFDERFEKVVFKISKDMSSAFVPVDSPNAVWSFDELKHETQGYTIAVDKVEFYNDETRIYLSVNNDGKATFYVDTDGSIIVQNKKQFNTEYIYDAGYKELPYGIVKGATATGAVSFPVVNVAEFEYIIEIHSDDYDEEFEDVVFNINLNVGQQENQTQPPETTEPNTKPNSGDLTGSNSNATEPTVPDRRQQAVAEVESLKDLDNSPAELKSRLVNMGFSNEEAEYGIQYANIDWTRSAIMKLEYFASRADQNNEITKKDCKNYLSTEHGYKSDVVQYALQNAYVDWAGLVSNYVMNQNDKWIEYTWCSNCGEVYGVHESCPFCNGNISVYSTYGYTKEELVRKFKSEGFSDSEISEGMQSYADEYFYDESKYKKP